MLTINQPCVAGLLSSLRDAETSYQTNLNKFRVAVKNDKNLTEALAKL